MSYRYWFFIVLTIALVGLMGTSAYTTVEAVLPPANETAEPTPQEVITQAWQKAIDSGVYEYDTRVEHTQYPVPKLSNSGRQPTTDFLSIAGQIDQAADKLEMTIWQDAGRHPERGVSVKVEDGRTHGRVGSGEWEEMNDLTSLFAPGRDPLGFLASIKNVTAVGQDSRQLGEVTVTYNRYAFELDGDAYAARMDEQMREHLRQFGSLPPGIRFSSADVYRQANGNGEIWLDANGLPVRLTMTLDIPAYRDNGRTVSDITTDFSNFDLANIEAASASTAVTFWSAPQQWLFLHQTEITHNFQYLTLITFILLTSYVILFLIFRFWQTPQFHATIAFLIIFALIIPPIITAEQAHAFSENLRRYQQEQEQEQADATALEEARAQLQSTNWDPHTNPLTSDRIKIEAQQVKESRRGKTALLQTANDFADSTDSDGDGLLDADEELWGTCAYPLNSTEYNSSDTCAGVSDPTDTDDDTLTDGVEVNDLGSSPLTSDTDQDGLADNLEIDGFDYNGQTWYPDFSEDDSNKDGIVDGAECLVWFEGADTYDPTAVCPDTDGDGTPDLFDNDNDNDGVPDDQDLSPNTSTATDFDYDNPFLFSADNLEQDKVFLLDLQFRPTYDDNLNLYNHVLDWPTNDTEGQITRYLDTTWADTANSDIQSDDDNAANGDIRLVPMLEITMPYTDGHYANLPITATASADRVLGDAVETWLDTDQLDPFSVTVEDVDTDSGDLVTYVPIVPVIDDYDTTVAYSAQMLYRPSQAEWGNDHEYRVVWLVQMITDQCIDDGLDLPESLCAREDVMTVIHTYYEEWELTGLNASEEHGLESAIVYEDPELDEDLDSDDQLWTLSWNLGNTFLRGRDCEVMSGDTCAENTDGERDVTVANLDSSIDEWLTSGRYLTVEDYSYDHTSYMSYLVATEAADLLDTTFAAYADDTIPTLMYVHESETRAINLDDDAYAIGNSLTLDFDPAVVEKTTMAYMSWTPYDYVGGTWTSHDTESYLDILEMRLDLDDYFQPADDSDTSEYEATGKVLWAQMYYASLMEGATALIEIDSETIFTPDVDSPIGENLYQKVVPDGVATGAGNILAAYAGAVVYTLGSLKVSVKEYFAAIGKAWTQSASQYTFSFYKQFKSGAYINYSYNVLTGLVLTTAVVGATLLAIGYFSGNDTVFRVGVVILSVVTIVVVGVYAINAIKTIYAAAKAATSFASGVKSTLAAARGFQASGKIGFVIGLALAWGLFFYQLDQGGLSSFEVDALIAYAIAGSIIAGIVLLFDLLGFGILGMILSIIDAILTIFGEQSATEWLTEAIAELLYDVHMVIDNLESSDRLDISMETFDLTTPALGFSSANSFFFSYGVINTLEYNDRFTRDEAEYRNVFVYDLQTDPESTRFESLDEGQMAGEWVNSGEHEIQTNDSLDITISLSTIGHGVNQNVELYLIESYFTSYEGCWFWDGFFGENGCEWGDTAGYTPIDLGDSLVYDILPHNIQTFARMDWDDALPTPIDEDADGLPSTDGTDPNDNDADTDGDGLLDTYEVSYGLNYQLADADNDGLTDSEELALDTNPLDSDSDGDGLNDYIETKDGWLVIYNGSELTRVYSDPNSADIDEDGLSDLDEFLFGFNPWVATDPSIIDTLVEFDDLTVAENTNLQMLLRMEESTSAEQFNDSSGNGPEAYCDMSAGTCPTSEIVGRYGDGLLFDGNNDYLDTDLVVDPAENGFTAALWFKPDGFDTGTYQRLIAQTENDGGGITWLGFESTGWFYTLVGGNYLAANTHATVDEWQHGAVTYDGTTLSIYLDGVLMNSTSVTSDPSSNPLRISTDDDSNDFYFNGAMDELAIFDRALTEDEIGDLMHGRYNPNDLYAAPGIELSYRATITNSTSTNASGFLVAETGYIDPELPDPLLALSFEKEQRLAYFESSLSTENNPLYCTAEGDTCPTSGQEGNINNSIAFDGVDDYLVMPGLIGEQDSSFSIFFWVYVESIPASGEIAMLIDSASTAEGAMDMYINSNGNLVMEAPGRGTLTTNYNFSSNLNKWVHVGLNGNELFINGNGNGGSLLSEERPTSIGHGRLGNSMAGTSPFHGYIDELVVYNDNLADGSGGSATSINEVNMIAGGDYTLHDGDDTYSIVLPQALYAFDEIIEYSGNLFYNGISGGEHGECWDPACPELTEDGEGYSGRAVLYDGVDDSIYQAGDTISADERAYTFYIKPLSYPAAGEVAYIYDTIGNGSDENYSFNLYMDENGQISYDGDDEFQTFDTVIPLNEWSKIRFWYDDGGSRYDAYLSVNDVTDSQSIGICSGTHDTCRDESQFIGPGYIGNNNAQDSPFHGYIDEISIRIAEYDFDPPVSSIGYENVANDLRTATCTDVFLCATVTEGKYGDGIYFDGHDDYLNLGNALDPGSTNFTIGLWFNMDEQTTYHRILEQLDGSGDGKVWLGITGTGHFYTYLGDNYLGAQYPAIDEWHYATLTYDGTTLRLYLNGELVNSNDTSIASSDGDVLMGISNSYHLPFHGSMDELIILSEAVDEEQIAFLMASTYPALETENEFETYTAEPIASTEASGSATIAENLPTSRYQFDLEVEAALELQTQIDFPVIDDNSDNLTAYFPFEDTPGSTYFDNLIPYEGYFGVMYDVEAKCYNNSCPTAGVRGLIGRATSFDGLDDFLEINFAADEFDGSKSNLPGIYSASVWVKGKKGTILDSRSYIGDDNAVRIDFDKIYQYETDADNNITTYETAFDMPIDEWTHLAFVIDPSNANTGTVYVNGQPVASGTHFTDDTTDLWTFGANFGQQNFFEGLIDDLRVYEVTLTAADVLALYEESAPVLRFEFDEDDTATAFYDETPNGYVGHPLATTAYNDTLGETVTTLNPAPGTDGKIGNTALFDSNGYIEVDGTDPLGANTSDVTIMAWIKTDDPTATQYIATSGRDNSNNGLGFGLYNSGLRFYAWGGKWYAQPTTIEADVWQHVAVTFDSSYDAHFYVNGEPVGTIFHNSPPTLNSDDPLYIGAHQNQSGTFNGYFNGQIDELAIYSRTLTEAEINGIYLQEYRWYRANSYNEIQVDLDVPTIEYLSDATYRPEGYIQLSVATRDTHSYINTFDFGVKGPNDSDFSWQSAPICGEAVSTGSAWCPYFDTAGYGGEGLYEVKFRAVDAVGNETTSDTHTIYVDGQTPTTTTSYSGQSQDAAEIGTLEWALTLSGNVNDPEIATGIAGSGVVSNSLQIGLFDASGSLIEDGWQTVTLNGSSWSIDYRFSGAKPSGTYTITLSAEDEVGNTAALDLGTVVLDERAPSAAANGWELPSEIISETTEINGSVVEQPEWGDGRAEYHFETDAAEITFYDSSGSDYHVACTGVGDCPTADLTGALGQALTFDGIDDYMAATGDSPDLSTSSFTVAAWVNHTDNGDWRNIIGQKNTSGTADGWVLRLNANNTASLFVANGSSSWSATSPSAVPEGVWHHLVGVVDRSADELRLYVDGVLVDAQTGITGSLSTTTLTIGRWSSFAGDFFSGSMDEVYIFERALNETEIYALAQDDVQGVNNVEVLVEEQDLSSTAGDSRAARNTATWQPATVTNGAWNYTLPTNIEGFYTAQLRTTDNNGNTAVEGLIWRGTIDDIAPRISASGEQIGGSNSAQTEYTFTIADFILDENSLDQPCETADLTTFVYTDEALPQNGTAYQVSATCRVDGHEASRDFSACDVFGNCATITVNPTPTAVGNILITSPSNLATFAQNETINFAGEAYDPSTIDSITLYANGSQIALASYSGNDTTWTASWTPTVTATYDIDAVMVGSSGTYTDSITVSVVDGTAHSLAISATLQGRSDYTAVYTVTAYTTNNITPTFAITATADISGHLTVAGFALGTYTLTLQTDSYLMAVETVTVTGSNDTADFGELLAGDANADNAVNILDLSILAGAYNTTDGVDAGYDSRADFNGDGQVNILDLSLLAGNYNTVGERP